MGQRASICRVSPTGGSSLSRRQGEQNLSLDRSPIRSILPLEVAKIYELFNEETGTPACQLTKKEIAFLEDNLEEGVEEDEEFVLTDEDISHLILCDAEEGLVEKLKKSLGDEFRGVFYYSRR